MPADLGKLSIIDQHRSHGANEKRYSEPEGSLTSSSRKYRMRTTSHFANTTSVPLLTTSHFANTTAEIKNLLQLLGL